MGIQINVGDHTSPYAGYVAVPHARREVLRWARTHARSIAQGNPAANRFYKTLLGGRSLTQLLDDRNIWINYAPSLTLDGQAKVSGKELALGPGVFPKGKWMVLGTLLHELAHINGATEKDGSTLAEEALYHCGLGTSKEYYDSVDDPSTPYNPGYGG